MNQVLSSVISFVFDTYIFMMVLQMILESQRMGFHHNLILDSVGKYTRPLVKPFYRWIKPPANGGIDYAFVIALVLLECVQLILLAWLKNGSFPNLVGIGVWAFGNLGNKFINLYFFIVLIAAVIDWFPPIAKHPLAGLVQSLARPLLKPVMGLIPKINRYDVSPLVILVVLKLLSFLIFDTLIANGMRLAS
ncbi:MAG TPA: YggT family protein [Coxiellaceae bacterium]|nr:YggT family protein [Coxiellaceae bacterium]